MDKQTDEGDIIGRCPTYVKRPIGKCHTEICFKKWIKNRSLWYSKRYFTPGAICVICLECSQRKYFLQLLLCRCSSELAQLVPLPYSRGRPTRYFDKLHDFSVTIPICYKDLYVKFPRKVKLWNYLPIECFLLTYDLNGLSLELTDTFYLQVLVKQISCINLFVFLFLVTPCLVVAVQPCME